MLDFGVFISFMTISRKKISAKLIKDEHSKKILDAIRDFEYLGNHHKNLNHPLYSQFSAMCEQAEDLLRDVIEANQSTLNKMFYNYRVIEQLTEQLDEMRQSYREDRKKLTESLGSAYLAAEESTNQLKTDTEELNRKVQERVNELTAENTELKQVARANIKESQLKSEFLNILSHELRTPLNAIIGYSQIILNGIYGPVNESIENDIEAINKNGKHLLKMFNQMLAYAKYGSGKVDIQRQEVYIETFLEAVIKQLNSLIQSKPIQFQLLVKEGLSTGFFDRDKIFQVIINLVDNAIKHTEKGLITLTADFNEETQELILGVEDTGIGIKKEDVPKVFDPFHQVNKTNSKESGTGLGLTITKQIVEHHKGRVEMHSQLGEGTRVNIFIPQRS